MAIKGSLKEASLADVCQLLALGQKTGCLSVTDRSRFGQIYFAAGRITYARVVNRRDRLGDMLVRDSVLSQEQMDAVLSRQAEEPDRRVGELLVEQGHISEADLGRYVRQQIEEAIYHLFTWARGSFYFEVDEFPDTADILVSVNPESLLLEAARRVDEWSLIEKKIPSLDLVFEVERERLRVSDVELTAQQQRIALLLDGERSVQDIVDESGLTEFDVGQALFGLIQAGFCHRVGRRQASRGARGTAAELLERRNLGTAFFRAGMLEDAEREFGRVLELEPHDLAARFHLALVAMRDRRYRAAVQQLKSLLEDHGPQFAAFTNLALALRALERFDDALLVLDEADALRPGTGTVSLARALTLTHGLRIAEAAEAYAEYRRRLGAETPSPQYYHFAGLAAALGGDLDRAAALATEGIDAHPAAAAVHILAGLVHERRGNLDQAEACYRRAAQEEPGVAQAHKNLGDVMYRRGLHEDALEHYQRAAELNPDLGDDLHAKIGNLLYKDRQREEAVRHWRRALELNPENRVVRNNLEIVAHAG